MSVIKEIMARTIIRMIDEDGKEYPNDKPFPIFMFGIPYWYADGRHYTLKEWCEVDYITEKEKAMLLLKYS